jgi:hypothetical protein
MPHITLFHISPQQNISLVATDHGDQIAVGLLLRGFGPKMRNGAVIARFRVCHVKRQRGIMWRGGGWCGGGGGGGGGGDVAVWLET